MLVFSEWERMLELVREMVQEMGVGFAWHTGSVPQDVRRREVRRFKDDPDCRLFLSTDSGGVGLNLQAANVVINLDLPWNPARLEQRIARAWRKHQTRPVHVVNLVTEDSIEQRMIPLLARKQALADGVLDARGNLGDLGGLGESGEPGRQPLSSGRAAFLEKVAAVLGNQEAPPVSGVPAGGGEAPIPDRSDAPRFDAPGAPAVEPIDPATFAAIERLVAAGILQFTSSGAAALHRSAVLDRQPEEEDRERRLRAQRAREVFAQAERKVRMAAVLAGGGFPVEGLPPLREGIELTVEALARFAGKETADLEASWLEEHLPRHGVEAGFARSLADMVTKLRSGSEALLAVDDATAQAWIDGGQTLARQAGALLRG